MLGAVGQASAANLEDQAEENAPTFLALAVGFGIASLTLPALFAFLPSNAAGKFKEAKDDDGFDQTYL